MVSSSLYDPRDVNRDGHVSPIDAVLIINYLNSLNGGDIQAARTGLTVRESLDVDGDEFISPIDAVEVINYLNSTTQTVAQAEAADAYFDEVDQSSDAEGDFWMLLALDMATESNNRK